jgi:capsid portal protein
MKKLALVALFLMLASSCAVYHDRYGTRVVAAPEFYGTVTYVDTGAGYINLDYYDNGVRVPRVVYYGNGTTWDGLRYSDLRVGDKVWVNGHQRRGRWEAEHLRRYQ